MEMVLKYVAMNRQRDEEKKRARQLRNVSEDWYPMHGSTAHKISIFAGRRTGKTYNIALKALRSDRDVIIYIGMGTPPHIYLDTFRRLISSHSEFDRINSVYHDASTLAIVMDNGRRIQVADITQYLMSLNHDWRGKLILVDEFDVREFEELIRGHEYRFALTHQIICVGSMYGTRSSFGKMWFNSSELNYYIDTDDEMVDSDLRSEEIFPSRYKSLIANMPPPHMSPASGIQVTLRL